MAIDKLISKFDKVKKSINSIKGIRSKIQAFNYTTAIDALGKEKKSEAMKLLQDRKDRLVKGGAENMNQARVYSCRRPPEEENQIIYPEYDELHNWIVFTSLPRRDRIGERDHPVFKEREVALYIPDTLISQAQTTYTADTIGAVQRALANLAERAKQGDLFGAATEEGGKIITKFIGESFNKATGGYFNAARGRAGNPLQEQLLTGIPFRSWDFTFDFFPKTKAEAEKVNKIIYFFRSSMLPDAYTATYKDLTGQGGGAKDDKAKANNNASYLNYPNIFNIRFEGPIAGKIDGFLPAVCANAQIDYAGGQKFSTFYDGQPAHIQLTLNFLEIQTMTLGNYENTVSNYGDPDMFAINDTIVNQQYKLKGNQVATGKLNANGQMIVEEDETLGTAGSSATGSGGGGASSSTPPENKDKNQGVVGGRVPIITNMYGEVGGEEIVAFANDGSPIVKSQMSSMSDERYTDYQRMKHAGIYSSNFRDYYDSPTGD